MEFRDIKNFSLNNNNQSTYEDNPDFCRERYRDAKLACACLFSDSYGNLKYDDMCYFIPVMKNVKLNALKKYEKEIGADISSYTKTEWEEMSVGGENYAAVF